jgi:hypothetical protein
LSDQEKYGQIPGIHIEIEHNLQVMQHFMAELVGLVNDNHRNDPFLEGKTVYFILYIIKNIVFVESAYGGTECPLLRRSVARLQYQWPASQEGVMPRKALYMSSM